MNGDGFDDLLVISDQVGTVSVFLGGSDGIDPARVIQFSGQSASSLGAGPIDIDGNGVDDLVFSLGAPLSPATVFVYDGPLMPGAQPNQSVNGPSTVSVFPSDLN